MELTLKIALPLLLLVLTLSTIYLYQFKRVIGACVNCVSNELFGPFVSMTLTGKVTIQHPKGD